MSGRFFCMYCGSANFASPFASHFECKSCNQLIELPHNQSTNQSVASSPSTPSCASTISSRCLSVESSGSLSPASTNSVVPDLSLESTSDDDDETDPSIHPSGNPLVKKRRRSSAKKRDPRAPKRAANAYMLFCKQQRPLLRAARPELPFAVIGQTLGDMWRNLSISQRKPYEARAADDRDRYKMEMHAFTATTLRNTHMINPSVNHSLGSGQSVQPSINPNLLHAMAHNLHMQAQAAQWADSSASRSMHQSMTPSMNQSMSPLANQAMNHSMMQATNQQIGRDIKQQNIPLMVQQAQQHFLQMQRQRYHPYNQSNNQMNNMPMHQQLVDRTLNSQTLNVEPINHHVNHPVPQSNNQFHYGPMKRDRRFSYQSISSISQSVNQSNNHGLISTVVKSQMNEPFNSSFTQTNAPFTFENFNAAENQLGNQPSNQSNSYFDFPNDHLDFDASNIGLWDTTFDDI